MKHKNLIRKNYSVILFSLFLLNAACSNAQPKTVLQNKGSSEKISPGAYQMEEYLPALKNKRVALLVNQTSEINDVLLPDTLLALGVNVVKIFSPEHGFRGNADAGAAVKDGKDAKTGLPVISLYGKNKKPDAEMLRNVDIVVYDLQDVGVRFYTYISSLEYMMEACAEQKIPIMILDRPNPLGNIVDGPVLQRSFKSFVGMQPIPVIYGMTPAEYAKMLIGEKWLSTSEPELRTVLCKNYTHDSLYRLPIAPSPNLKNMTAIYLYPSLCFFEGTVISVGRGTDKPFQMYGNPVLKNQPDTFRPLSQLGASNPMYKGLLCHGKILAKTPKEAIRLTQNKLQLKWLMDAYQNYPNKEHFFNNFFNILSGNAALKNQIKSGASEAEIRNSWEHGLENFKEIRTRYLLYP